MPEQIVTALPPIHATATRALELEPGTGWPLAINLPDGRLAFYPRREDDCARAAIATLLQVHISDVPDPH